MKVIKKKYPQDFPYKETYNIILEFKINLIKHGLMESSLNEMDLYLRELFKKYEKEKPNWINVNDLGEALRNSDKIILSNVQVKKILLKKLIKQYFKRFLCCKVLWKKTKIIC